MLRLLAAFEGVAFFRHGPEAIPASAPLFVLTLLANAAVTLLAVMLLNLEVAEAAAAFAIGVAMVLSLSWLVLQAVKRTYSYLPCVTAIMGAEAIIGIGAVLLGIAGVDFGRGADAAASIPAWSVVAVYTLRIWSLAVTGFVLQRAAQLTVIATIAVVGVLYVLHAGAADLLLGDS